MLPCRAGQRRVRGANAVSHVVAHTSKMSVNLLSNPRVWTRGPVSLLQYYYHRLILVSKRVLGVASIHGTIHKKYSTYKLRSEP
uniref:Uncharacterized protein n=1 Tax=Anopheles dirus TaxID=7168 RepID=A0A182NX09_9DIPT